MEQTEYDFSVVRRVVSQFNAHGAIASGLVGWKRALTDGHPCLSNNGVIGSTLKLIEAMDRPRMLDRFHGYARAVLSPAEFSELVVKPQVSYDFDQLLRFVDQDNGDLLDEIVRYRDLVIAGETLPRAYQYSPEFVNVTHRMAATLSHRPRFLSRLQAYLLTIGALETDDDTPDVWIVDDGDAVEALDPSTDDDDAISGGLPPNLLGPPLPLAL